MPRIPVPHPRTGQPRSRARAFGSAAVLVFIVASVTTGALFGFRPGTVPAPAANQSNSALALVDPLPGLAKIPWEGGPGYWSQFPRSKDAGWTDPSFFPISVFMGKPEHAAALKALGINTYMGAEHDGSPLSSITKQGIFVLPQDEWTQSEVGDDPHAVGWFISDECDMGIGCTGSSPAENLADQARKVERVRAFDDGRFTMANYANGVLDTYWARGSMAQLMEIVDVASVDKYAYTSPFVDDQMTHSPHWPAGSSPASAGSYGWVADRMRSYQDPAGQHPNWIFVEAAMPLLNDAGSLTITPDQIEGAAWSAIIHEARGLAYFQHNNGPICGFYSLVECDRARLDRITEINTQIQSLAPVLNTQSYQYSFNDSSDTMLKVHGGSAYIFAGVGLHQAPGLKTFALPRRSLGPPSKLSARTEL